MKITAEFSVLPGDSEPRLRFISDTPGKCGIAVEDSVDHRVFAADTEFRRMTTLTERWSAKDFSFSHIMFGSVDAWLHKYVACRCVDGVWV